MRHNNEICDPRYYLFMEKESGGHVVCCFFCLMLTTHPFAYFHPILLHLSSFFILISHCSFISSFVLYLVIIIGCEKGFMV